MSDKPILSEQDAAKLTENYNRLFTQSQEQLAEHKMWLKANMKPEHHVEIDQITAVPTIETEVKDEHGRDTLSVVYTYPDNLYAWLAKNAPKVLKGGHLMPERAQGEGSGVAQKRPVL